MNANVKFFFDIPPFNTNNILKLLRTHLIVTLVNSSLAFSVKILVVGLSSLSESEHKLCSGMKMSVQQILK